MFHIGNTAAELELEFNQSFGGLSGIAELESQDFLTPEDLATIDEISKAAGSSEATVPSLLNSSQEPKPTAVDVTTKPVIEKVPEASPKELSDKPLATAAVEAEMSSDASVNSGTAASSQEMDQTGEEEGDNLVIADHDDGGEQEKSAVKPAVVVAPEQTTPEDLSMPQVRTVTAMEEDTSSPPKKKAAMEEMDPKSEGEVPPPYDPAEVLAVGTGGNV
jgi:hypothetical protein